MPTFKVRTQVTTYYEHEVEADNLEDALAIVEDDEHAGVEYDSAAPVATNYAIEGQMGWNDVE